MHILKSKFSILRAIFLPSVFFLIISPIIIPLYIALHQEFQYEKWFTLVNIILVGIPISGSIFFYLTKLVSIRITPTHLHINGIFKKNSFALDDIDYLDLFAREKNQLFFIKREMEGIRIELLDGRHFIIYAQYYRNTKAIRQRLMFIHRECNIRTPESVYKKQKAKENAEVNSSDHEFIGNYMAHGTTWLSLLGGLGGIALIVLGLFIKKGILLIALGLILIAIFYGWAGSFLHFFRLEGEYLLVHNNAWFWRTHRYLLSDIELVANESLYFHSDSVGTLILYTTSCDTKQYLAVTLKAEDWKAFRKALKDKGVTIRS